MLMHSHPALLVLLASATVACGAGRSASIGTAPTPEPTESSPAAIARARADSARYPYTAADIAFMQGMIGHHAQAIVMSRLAPTRTESASIRTLAARIINAQQDEIAIMERWLRDRQQPVADTSMAGHQHMGHPMMPGMLTDAQMAELEAARGDDFDRRFLRLMIQHHEGAITMVTDLFATDGAAQDQTVFRFASDAQVDQRTEIARMQRMLAALLFAQAEP
jgi:uncharacterized protein (DUF305 family)